MAQVVMRALCAAILIDARSCGNSWTKRALGSKPLVGVGLISYSLYLWNWPLIVFAQLASPFPLGTANKWALLAAAAVLVRLVEILENSKFPKNRSTR
jgi:peptidoglycan/LPS O-acetylase OafA/YrhL